MTKKRMLMTAIFALLIVALLIPAGAVLAQYDGPTTFRMREWGFYYWPADGMYLGIPAQGLNHIYGTYIDIEVIPYGVQVGDIYPLAPILSMRYYEDFWDAGSYYNRQILLGEAASNWATICYPVTDTMLVSVEGDPYRLSIAWARQSGQKWWPIKTYYNAEYQSLCIVDRDITGIYSVVDMAYWGYPW
jgi:hypothetical protein